ncbi:Malignant brain tumor repeat protein 1 [Caenorhabditis elegans]|uniref:Isoform b of Malignant brain tumor repeat protein 1 n=1 Tax=Caenorhabditis elegans TaxID=6239 RepID=A0SQM0-2|nr:Malignant brain tumor repeat protein 1 [Caenorhabditis elegans]CCD67945.1 Malignant brain tumor repeat protein 1 [Caenorhabditis elegans]|eukprot:NP_001122543.1 Malignant brain tumor repeat protein 1 [Caenorhabditis elegans]
MNFSNKKRQYNYKLEEAEYRYFTEERLFYRRRNPVEKIAQRIPKPQIEGTFTWSDELRCNYDGNTQFLPVEALEGCLPLEKLNQHLKPGFRLEVVVRPSLDPSITTKSPEIRWFGEVTAVCGFYVAIKFVGELNRRPCWFHMLSEDIFDIGSGLKQDPAMKWLQYRPLSLLKPMQCPKFWRRGSTPAPPVPRPTEEILDEFQAELHENRISEPKIFDQLRHLAHRPSRFRLNQRVELLNYLEPTEIRVARILRILGRRLMVMVTAQDYPEDLPSVEAKDRQVQHENVEFWVDESSFFLFPVGFAMINGLRTKATEGYLEHSRRIAEGSGSYHKDDVTFEQLFAGKPDISAEKLNLLKVGQKFELLDPLSDLRQSFCVATIRKICKTPGFLIISPDETESDDESFPIHIDNHFMHPVGYAEKFGIKLDRLAGTEPGKFKWEGYLKEKQAEKIPDEMLRPLPSKERRHMFEFGRVLEAVGQNETYWISPASVEEVHGRTVLIEFQGWDSEFSELYDMDSHDLLPAGWCEFFNFKLRHPVLPVNDPNAENGEYD